MRPTSAKVREAVFDVLGSQVEYSNVLDLFAGTGAFGFEALSRGASKVCFVEKRRASAHIIQKNARELGVDNLVTVKVTTAAQAIKGFERSRETFSIVFLDPPYNSNEIAQVWQQPALKKAISDEGILIVESRFPNPDLNPPHFLKKYFQRRYGDTLVEMFCVREEE